MADYTQMPIDEMEAIWSGSFKRARAALGVTAFGLSVSDLPPDFDRVPAHVHTFDDQEEIYMALAGGGWLEINGERVALTLETIVRVGPTATRRPISGPEGLRLLSVGGVLGKPYEVFPSSIAGAPEAQVSDLPGVSAAREHQSSDDFIALGLEEMDPLTGYFDGIRMYPVRRALGVTSFGVSAIDIAPAEDAEDGSQYPEHEHADSGQEEVYVVLRGDGEIKFGDERVALAEGQMVRVGPEQQRKLIPGARGIRVLALGGTPGKAYEPPRRAG